jgi:metal-dependent hydrolase (beta-lactamase superfamily II)
MLQARTPRLAATADYLAELDLEVCAPCHCTGKRAVGLLRDRLGAAFVEVRSGSRIELA